MIWTTSPVGPPVQLFKWEIEVGSLSYLSYKACGLLTLSFVLEGGCYGILSKYLLTELQSLWFCHICNCVNDVY